MTVAVQTRGAGRPLVCLHGIGSSADAFAPQLAGLSDRYRVIAWDAPGYARSADPDEELDLAGFAAAAASVIAGMEPPVHLLGVSWGGVIAARVALEHPELLRSLILIDSSPGSAGDPRAAALMRARPAELAELGGAEFARRRAFRLLSAQAPAALVDQVARTMASAIRLPGYRMAAESMAATDLRPRLGEIDLPTLVLCGSEDQVTGTVASIALWQGISQASYGVIRGAGHLANQERPDAVNSWIAGFLHTIDNPDR